MRKKIDKWMSGRAIAMQEVLSRKSQGMGTVEIILIIVYIFTMKYMGHSCEYRRNMSERKMLYTLQ